MNSEHSLSIGPKSTQCLNEIGIYTDSQLIEIGAVQTFIKIKNSQTKLKPSLNLLYALVAIEEGCHWHEVAKNHKSRLLNELDGLKELDDLFTASLKKTKG